MQNLTTEIQQQQQQQFAMTGYQSFQPQPHEYQMQHGVTMSSESVQTNPFPRMWQTFQPLYQQSNVSRQQQHACLGVPHLIQFRQQEQQSQQDTGAEVMMRQPSGKVQLLHHVLHCSCLLLVRHKRSFHTGWVTRLIFAQLHRDSIYKTGRKSISLGAML